MSLVFSVHVQSLHLPFISASNSHQIIAHGRMLPSESCSLNRRETESADDAYNLICIYQGP